MGTGYFDRPVKILFGGPGKIRVVSSAREAGEVLISPRWPAPDTGKHLAARLAALAVLEGKKQPDVARKALIKAATEADILIDD